MLSGQNEIQIAGHWLILGKLFTIYPRKVSIASLLADPEDKTLVRQLGNIDNLIDCTGMFSPIQSGLALTKCEFVISNDTGPMHLAYTMGVKVIALFSSRDYPGLWFPPTDKNIVLRSSNIKCSICLLESCSDNICMQAIKPAAVIDAVEKLLER